jgi:hypothetical protein
MIEIPVFWFVVLILACLWLGGALVLAILAYIEWTDKDAVSVLEIFRCWWETQGLGISTLERLASLVFSWVFYPAFLFLAWVGCLIDSRRARKSDRNKTGMSSAMEEPYSVQEIRLKHDHPEITGFIPEMLGVYVTHIKQSNDNLGEVYAHVMGCDWCRTEFESRKK